MGLFPSIARACPYIDRLGEVMEDDFCRMCQRRVTDLDAMDDRARAAFLAACSGEVCVSYRSPRHNALAAAAALATIAVPLAAVMEQGRPSKIQPGAALAARGSHGLIDGARTAQIPAPPPIPPYVYADRGYHDTGITVGMILPPDPATLIPASLVDGEDATPPRKHSRKKRHAKRKLVRR